MPRKIRSRGRGAGAAAALLLAGAALAPRRASAAVGCEDLVGLTLAGVSIGSAQGVDSYTIPPATASGAATVVPGPFCRVVAKAGPVPGSNINFEVWLPPAGAWNGVNGGPIPGQRGGVKAGHCRQDLLLCKGAPIGAPLHGAGLSRGQSGVISPVSGSMISSAAWFCSAPALAGGLRPTDCLSR
jgi:hypothetical protein